MSHTNMKLPELLAKPFVQAALKQPKLASSVLSFWFGLDYQDPSYHEQMKFGAPLQCMTELWFWGDTEFDKICASFTETIRQIRSLPWPESSADHCAAKVILCDQLSRNIFRGTNEAFTYDAVGMAEARKLIGALLQNSSVSLEGEIYPPYICFAVVALLHSEQLQDHDDALQVLDRVKEATPECVHGFWDYQKKYVIEHRQVIERFGRYPHRNKAMNRETNEAEQAWLDDVDNLPGWAKTQMT